MLATTPAWLEGTSIVALSVSSVISGVSTAMRSPIVTSTSMTDTSEKLPRSGTVTVTPAPCCLSLPLKLSSGAALRDRPQQARHVRKRLAEEAGEADGRGAVDGAVVVRERQRQHQPRHERATLIDGLVSRFRHPEDRDLRRVDDRRERRAADSAEARDREARALHVGGRELAGARLLAQHRKLTRQFEYVL